MLTPSFTLSDNSKVKFRPNHRNTFGLNYGLPVDGGTCPGATFGSGGCLDVRTGNKRKTCYMAKITQIYKAVGTILDNNTQKVVGKTYEEQVQVLTNTFQNFVNDNSKEYWYFRLLYSGDIFSEQFAKAIVESCGKFPEVKFWLYTRSHDYVPIIVQAPNVAVYLSIDPVNMKTGLAVYESLRYKYNNIGLAHLGPLSNNDTGIKFVGCPETHGQLPNTAARGACAACKLCFTYNDRIRLRNINFKLH
jgi:hypothetical protein